MATSYPQFSICKSTRVQILEEDSRRRRSPDPCLQTRQNISPASVRETYRGCAHHGRVARVGRTSNRPRIQPPRRRNHGPQDTARALRQAPRPLLQHRRRPRTVSNWPSVLLARPPTIRRHVTNNHRGPTLKPCIGRRGTASRWKFSVRNATATLPNERPLQHPHRTHTYRLQTQTEHVGAEEGRGATGGGGDHDVFGD